jgi:hypothetical protein
MTMATSKKADPKAISDELPPEKRFRPGPMPTQGDETREVGKRAHDDVQSRKKDTDEAGYDRQRGQAPSDSPIKRSGIEDGSKG